MIPIASIMRMWWKWVGFDNNDEDKNEKDNCDEDDGGNLAGVLPIVLWSDPLNPQVVPVLAETLVPANLDVSSKDDPASLAPEKHKISKIGCVAREGQAWANLNPEHPWSTKNVRHGAAPVWYN